MVLTHRTIHYQLVNNDKRFCWHLAEISPPYESLKVSSRSTTSVLPSRCSQTLPHLNVKRNAPLFNCGLLWLRSDFCGSDSGLYLGISPSLFFCENPKCQEIFLWWPAKYLFHAKNPESKTRGPLQCVQTHLPKDFSPSNKGWEQSQMLVASCTWAGAQNPSEILDFSSCVAYGVTVEWYLPNGAGPVRLVYERHWAHAGERSSWKSVRYFRFAVGGASSSPSQTTVLLSAVSVTHDQD